MHPGSGCIERFVLLAHVEVDGTAGFLCGRAQGSGGAGSTIGATEHCIDARAPVLAVGAEINAEMEHQTAKDTTIGPDRPMGQRGATMADTVGAAKA